MGYWGGLIRGVAGESSRVREESLRREELNAAREAKVFEALANSDDPEIASLAIAGMLHASNPKGKKSSSFFRRFLGEAAENPIMGQLRQAMGQPGSAALPQDAAVEPGAPPMPPPMASPTGRPMVAAQPAAPRIGPRQVFMTPLQRHVAEAQGSYTGRMTAALGAYRQATTPAERRLVSGMAGAPERVQASKNVTLVYADGTSEAGSYDPYAEPGAEYTTATGQQPTKPIKEVRNSGLSTTGNNLRYFRDDQGNVTAVRGTEVVGEIPGIAATGPAISQAPPTPSGERVTFDPRNTANPYQVDPNAPPAPPAAQAGGPEQATAAGIVAQAEREAQRMPSALGGGYQAGALDRAVATISKGVYKTYADAVAAARTTRSAGPPPPPTAAAPAAPAAPAPGGLNIDAIRQRIQQNRQQVH